MYHIFDVLIQLIVYDILGKDRVLLDQAPIADKESVTHDKYI